ncbi:DNA-binding MarR family transcriptional regulator [Paraburkholderia sp. GAS199]|uniref:MarR family winged helix-turn-helix transcriptional regulator n=1 Tax=Paraburkholderia sp. GAS199 TaxID=3035126 RepID=UPI003D1C7895
MKTRVHSEESRQAESFLDHLSGKKGESRGEPFPPENYRYELSQLQILATLLERLYIKRMLPLHDLPLLEWRLLEAIGSSPGITAAEFSQYWVYDKVTVSRALKALKDRELVESGPHPTDGRRTELRLTDAGREVFESQLDAKQRQLEALSSVLSEKEMTEYTRLSRKLIDHFRRVNSAI